MEIVVERLIRSVKTTIGKMYVDGAFQCFTLEDVDRGLKSSMPLDEIKERKIYGNTAIPEGRYEVTITYSGLFKKNMPLVNGVKGYEAIRIHPGNSEADTLGCILVGEAYTAGWVSSSRVAFDKLFPKIQAAITAGEKVYLTIKQ